MPFDWTRLAQTHLGVAAITLAVIEQLAAPQPIPGSTWARGFGGRPVDPEELAALAGVPVKRLYEHLAKAETAGIVRRVRRDEGWVLEFSTEFLLNTSIPVFRDSGKSGKQEDDTRFPVFPDSGNPGIPENRTPPDPPHSLSSSSADNNPPCSPPQAGAAEPPAPDDGLPSGRDIVDEIAFRLQPFLASQFTSPRDYDTIGKWIAMGATLDMFPAVLEEGLKRFREREHPDGRPSRASWYTVDVEREIKRRQAAKAAEEAMQRGARSVQPGGAGPASSGPGGDRPQAPGARAAAAGSRSRPSARDEPTDPAAYWNNPWVTVR